MGKEMVLKEILQLKQKVKELETSLKKSQADFENYQKRVETQQLELIQYANANLILKITPILDNFKRAATHLPKIPKGIKKEEKEKLLAWIEGINQIKRALDYLLKEEGLRKIETLGQKFDPYYHEAIAYQVNPKLKEGIITEELEAGYLLGDKVIKPAKVKVNKGT